MENFIVTEVISRDSVILKNSIPTAGVYSDPHKIDKHSLRAAKLESVPGFPDNVAYVVASFWGEFWLFQLPAHL